MLATRLIAGADRATSRGMGPARRRLALAFLRQRLTRLPFPLLLLLHLQCVLLLRVFLQQLLGLRPMLLFQLLLMRFVCELLVLSLLLLLQSLPLRILLSGQALLLLQMLPLERAVGNGGRGGLGGGGRFARVYRPGGR